jgi:tetratricopeptide (TPR) repeat protein
MHETLSEAEPTLPSGGAEIGGYQVVRRLGAGGMGQVFEARSPTGEVVALKQLALVEPTLLYRFKQEFRSLADLQHANLVRLGELVVLTSGLAFFTMELVEGQPLVRWVRLATPAGTAPNLHRVCHALRQLAAGVAHLHHAARIHRDLKPSNVHVTAEGRVVILDFGLVFELSDDDARITATGQLIGTPAYMAPEQATRSAIGPPVDLYAIGVTLFECLTGCMPFVGSTVRVLLNKQHEPAPDPRELAAGIPDWLAQLCRALLDVDPEHRPSAERIIAVIDDYAEAAPLRLGVDEARAQLFGRDRELALLEQAQAQVTREGRAVVVRLTGPAGRGKSALLDRFLQSLRESEAVLLRGRCHPRESVPYKGVDSVIDALARHLRSLPAVDAATLQPRHVRELCELFPVLAGIWRESGRRLVEHEPVMRRRFAIEALREVLARIGDAATLVVTIDDFHHADLDGLGVLGELLLPSEPPAMLLILAYDGSGSGPVVRPISEPDVLRGATLVELELGPLDEAAALLLARSLSNPQSTDASALELARESHGEPLAIVRKCTVPKLGDVTVAADGEVLRRIRALDSAARMLLELATVAGVALANELIRAALGTDSGSFELTTSQLVHAGLLATVAVESHGIIKLADARIGELVRVELDGEREIQLHACLAEALAANGADAELIAEHFERGGNRERGRAYTVEAARAAAEALAFVRAERLFRRAIELLAHDGSDRVLAESRTLRLALADQLAHLARCPEAAALYVEVARECPAEQAAKLRLRAAMQYAMAGSTQLALPLLRELMRDAGERLPSKPLEVLLIFSWNQLRLRFHGRRIRLREPKDIPAQELARFDVVYAANMTLSKREMLPTLALRPRVLHLALAAGEPSRLVYALTIESSLLVTIGRPEHARKILARARAIAEQLDDSPAIVQVHVCELFLHASHANLAEAEACYDAALHGVERFPDQGWLLSPTLHTFAMLLRRTGEYERLQRLLPGWISLLHDLGHRQFETLLICEEVIMLAQVGDLALARRSLERGRQGWALDYYTFVDYLLNVAEIRILLAEGRASEANTLAERTRVELRRHGLTRFKLPRVRMREACGYAALIHAIAANDPRLTPKPRELRRLRRSGLPKFATTAVILAAGRASLLGNLERERALWREALDRCEQFSLRGLAAAVRRRLVELDVADAAQLDAEARAYFVEQEIEDVERFVTLLAPAKRKAVG